MSEGFRLNRPNVIDAGGDWNNITIPGFYKGTDITNAPIAGVVCVIVNGDNAGNAEQQALAVGNPGELYRRTYIGGAWGIWDTISTAGGGGVVTSVFGRSGGVTAVAGDYTAAQITAAASATNYTPAASTVEGHLSGIDTALGTVNGGSA